jgi:hypothetical protein
MAIEGLSLTLSGDFFMAGKLKWVHFGDPIYLHAGRSLISKNALLNYRMESIFLGSSRRGETNVFAWKCSSSLDNLNFSSDFSYSNVLKNYWAFDYPFTYY